MSEYARLPFYYRSALILLALVLFVFILYIGQEIIVPLVFSLLMAILLNPVVSFLQKRKMGRVTAISVSVTLLVIVVALVVYFIAFQMAHFREAWPVLQERARTMGVEILNWLSNKFNISETQINKLIESKKADGISAVGSTLGGTILSISNLLIVLFLVPVYIFLFLYYKPLLLHFVARIFKEEHSDRLKDVLESTKSLIQSYLVGLLLEISIVAVLNSIGLFIIGVDYAIAIGAIGALFNLIPYIGGVVGIGLPVVMALMDGTYMSAIAVVGVYSLIQIIDNNFIVPMVVASKVKVNALVSIVVVLIGGAIWGVGGMFLAIPLTAIVKVVFDSIPMMQPYGELIGDDLPQLSTITNTSEPIKSNEQDETKKAES